jgi:hypothetical protein
MPVTPARRSPPATHGMLHVAYDEARFSIFFTPELVAGGWWLVLFVYLLPKSTIRNAQRGLGGVL